MSSILSTNDERRSSVRVKSLLPISVVSIEESDLEGLQSRILDLAVLAEDNELKDKADWNERTDEISRDVLYLLQEVRSLRRHLAEIQRLRTSAWTTRGSPPTGTRARVRARTAPRRSPPTARCQHWHSWRCGWRMKNQL